MADILQIIANLESYIPNFLTLTGIVFFFIGLILAISAVRGAARRSEMGAQSGSYFPHIFQFIIAAFFISFPVFEQVLSVSLLDEGVTSNPQDIFSYAPSLTAPFGGDESSVANEIIAALTAVIMFVGVIAVGRGLYLLNIAAQGVGQVRTFGPGITFLIAGILAANYPVFMRLVENLVTAPAMGP